MIFSTSNAIVITGLKHGSSQLYHSAHLDLGIPYVEGNTLEFIKTFKPRVLYNLIEQGIQGEELLKKMNLSLSNSIFCKRNYVYDFSRYLGKPVIMLIRDPLRAAQSSMVEDMVNFLNEHGGLLASKSKKVREVFNYFDTHTITKTHLEKYLYVEDLFFELNTLALNLKTNYKSTIFEHTDYEHLSYIVRIASFFELNKRYGVEENILYLDIDKKYDKKTEQRLQDDLVLTKNMPAHSRHTTSDLIKKLPNFIKHLDRVNSIYSRRLQTESALYSFINSKYKNKLFSYEGYYSKVENYQKRCEDEL